MPEEAANQTGDELDPELENAAGQYFQQLTVDDESSPDGGEGAGSGSTGSVEPDPQPSPTSDEWSWDDGYKLTKSQARSYAELEAFLYANPAKAEALANFLNGVPDDTTPSGIVETPAGDAKGPVQISIDDITDPEVRVVYEQFQAQQAELERLREEVTGTAGYISTQQEQTAQSLMTRATTSFQKEHNLTEDEMGNVANVAARLQVLPALMSPVDPMTGQARRVDPLAAIEEALSVAYWQIPEFRERAISSEIDNTAKDKARRQKLSSLQGSSGSVPREQPIADTPQGRREQMIAEVAGIIGKGKE
jgi:hypothetical protein